VTPRRKAALALLPLVLLGTGIASWFSHVPDPEYNGVKLGSYLTSNVINWQEAIKTLGGLGPRSVPFLIKEMTPDPAHEFLFRIAPKLPASLQKLTPDKQEYDHRRRIASALLWHLDSDARPALPHAFRAVERKDPVVIHNCINLIGWLCLGPPDETRAVHALILATESPDLNTRREALRWLSRVKSQYPQVIPALIRLMYQPGLGPTCMNSLVPFGTNALPALKEAAEKEKKGHIRLAALTIEKIEREAGKAPPTQ
jgi:hypothetical protein